MAKTVGFRRIFKLDSLSFATARGEIYEGDWRGSRKLPHSRRGEDKTLSSSVVLKLLQWSLELVVL